ncbi:MAG: hypothetical protein A2284_00415 [Deltaproteobacteria bacterium RIFOXYA12_FULL_61_11]|nr:MAG: hypothetical protein A2284_00415 [Deltaproteobacteria bacterium RIFOXYA12_FULL_61_11]
MTVLHPAPVPRLPGLPLDRVVIGAEVSVPLTLLDQAQLDDLGKRLRFENPDYTYQVKLRGRSTLPPEFDLSRRTGEHLFLPRGLAEVVEGFGLPMSDQTTAPVLRRPLALRDLVLRPDQEQALAALTSWPCGMLRAPTGFGKTVTALGLIAHLGLRTLVLVANGKRALLQQWVDALERSTDLAPTELGILGDGKRTFGEVTVALPQTLSNLLREGGCLPDFGLVLCDECHASTVLHLQQLYPHLPAARRYGISATPERDDHLHDLPALVFGPIRHVIDDREAVERHLITRFRVVRRETGLGFAYRFGNDLRNYRVLQRNIYGNAKRNELLSKDLEELLRQRRRTLVIVERLVHIHHLQKLLRGRPEVAAITGETATPERDQLLEAFRHGELLAILTTDQIFREGIDLPNLECILLPLLRQGELALTQAIGRGRRLHEDKDVCTVVDYVDRGPKPEQLWKKKLQHVYLGQEILELGAEGSLASLFNPSLPRP